MIELVGKRVIKGKNDKEYILLYYTEAEVRNVSGRTAGSVICSCDYADKLESYVLSGGTDIRKGWDKEKRQEFLYIPKN